MTTTETITKREKMVERVRAMFAKAASSSSEPEAEAFEAKALTIMAQYEIEERELRQHEDFDEDIIDLTSYGNAQQGAAALACWIAELFGGYGVLWTVGDGKTGRAKITATPSQLAQINEMLDHLLPQLRADLNRDKPRSRKSYALGWAIRVTDRIGAALQTAYAGESALVPTNTAARESYERENGAARDQKTRVDVRSQNAGDRAGQQADLNQGRITS